MIAISGLAPIKCKRKPLDLMDQWRVQVTMRTTDDPMETQFQHFFFVAYTNHCRSLTPSSMELASLCWSTVHFIIVIPCEPPEKKIPELTTQEEYTFT
mmetsp:Transcript_49973/g.82398  ORF Transcript_49973/g.82398 Transcript_49973/m.82398 type:complete len:98 (-) Transcript_49973:2761-3054(-)